jgi:hypothetical protein
MVPEHAASALREAGGVPGDGWVHVLGAVAPENDENELDRPVAKLPRRAGAQSLPEDETQIERADVNCSSSDLI